MMVKVEPLKSPGAGPGVMALARATVFTPAQAEANAQLDTVLAVGPIVALLGGTGLGKSTLLRAQAEQRGGRVISLREIVAATAQVHHNAYHDAFNNLLKQAFKDVDFIAVDDLDYFARIGAYPAAERGQYTQMVAKQLFESVADDSRKRLLIAGPPPDQYGRFFLDVLLERAAVVRMNDFSEVDYAAVAANILGIERAQNLDLRIVFRHASRLQGHQLRLACELMRDGSEPTAERCIEILDRHVLSSNVRTSEVELITFDRLPGAEHIAETLEINIILPLENRQLAQRMGLKPKRGVLLYGPPGTGKTVIGRALAHRMKGKFFMIDGSFISEPPGSFFAKLQSIVADAKANSPSVLFIDDADVLFKIDHIQGVVRFLLSLLDGLESETASNVCVMMTAMDVRLIPEAILRSGRVEVWLETKLPDDAVRARILRLYLGEERHLPGADTIDYAALAEATEGFTQADLRRVAGDAKSLYASDLVASRPAAAAAEYVRRAVENIMDLRSQMADSLGDETLRLKGGKTSSYFNKASATTTGEECGR